MFAGLGSNKTVRDRDVHSRLSRMVIPFSSELDIMIFPFFYYIS